MSARLVSRETLCCARTPIASVPTVKQTYRLKVLKQVINCSASVRASDASEGRTTDV